MTGRIILLPNLLDESQDASFFLPQSIQEKVEALEILAAESDKSARRYLRRFLSHERMNQIELLSLNEHSSSDEVKKLIELVQNGKVLGILSDAGLTCIADPGSQIVFMAQQRSLPVETCAGPCSIIFALQLSGFSGQSFTFHGYLPREEDLLKTALVEIEKQARIRTQLWIEAPYRTQKMFDFLLKTLQPTTYLSIQASLTLPHQVSMTKKVAEWRSSPLKLGKDPAIFLISMKD